MILNPIKLINGEALIEEADELEARLGPAGAIRYVRAKIAHAGRGGRAHLYRLHDEIIRRHPSKIPA